MHIFFTTLKILEKKQKGIISVYELMQVLLAE